MKKVLPSDIVNRRKQGFTPPDETWYKGPLLAYVTELLLSAKALERGLFEPKAVENIIHEHVSGKKNHRFLLWSLMCLEWWNRLFVDREHV
jgi:asparagine synthase (glutamine-hydrolysing)